MSEQDSIRILAYEPGEVFQHRPRRMVRCFLLFLEQLESRTRAIMSTNG